MGIAVLIRTTRAFSIKLFQFLLTDVVPFPSAPSNPGFDATKKQFDNFFFPYPPYVSLQIEAKITRSRETLNATAADVFIQVGCAAIQLKR